MIHLGCCAFNFPWLDLSGALRLAADLGFRRVDVGCSGPQAHVDQEAAAKDPASAARRVRDAAQGLELLLEELFLVRVHVDGAPVPTNTPDGALRDALLSRYRGLCQCAAEAGCTSIMGVPGDPLPGVPQEDAWALSREALVAMVGIAAEYGVAAHVEPHRGSLLAEPEAALRMADEVEGLRYTLDYSHYVGQGIAQERVHALIDRAGHMHGKPARPGLPKALLEHDGIDWSEVTGELQRRSWQGTVAIECIGGVAADGSPTYYEIGADGPLPPTRGGLTRGAVFQSVLLAAELERLLGTQAST